MIELRTNGKKITDFEGIDITLMLDTVASTFSFDGYFDHEKAVLRELYMPFSYKNADVWFVDKYLGINEKLITGTVLNVGLSSQKTPTLTNISGYSITGVLEDVSTPPGMHPLELNGLGLGEIAQRYCRHFGLKLFVFDNARAAAAVPYEKAKAQPGESPRSFLSKLAATRNITVAHDNLGRLLLYKVLARVEPAAKIKEGDHGIISISVTPNGQAVHSGITVVRQSSFDDENAGQYTATSPFVPKGIKRPMVKTLEFGENDDARGMAEAEVCREAKNFPITIQKQGWTFGKKLVRSGFYLEVEAPSIFVQKTKLVVESINFLSDKKNNRTSTITCVHPCVYTGVIPKKPLFA